MPRITEQFLVTITREADIPNFIDVIGGRLWSIDKVASDGVRVERVEATPLREPAAPDEFKGSFREAIDKFADNLGL